MDILLLISRLLDYPDEELFTDESGLYDIIQRSSLSEELKAGLQQFIRTQSGRDLLDVQSEYDGLFERGRSLGLWLFEHVHGESRDRGQAMVDLLNQYRRAGLDISGKELPDYIPLFLEFVATQGEGNARGWLQDIEHILALLQARLEKRRSHYSVLFEALLDIAASRINLTEIREKAITEIRDDTREALDREWAEEEVTFAAQSVAACTTTRKPGENQRADLDVPVHWVDFIQPNSQVTPEKRSSK